MNRKWLIAALVLVLLAGSALTTSAQGVVNLSIDDLDVEQFPRVTTRVTVRNQDGVPIAAIWAPTNSRSSKMAAPRFPRPR